MFLSTGLFPRCPHCHHYNEFGCDNTFVQDEGWYQTQSDKIFLRRHEEFMSALFKLRRWWQYHSHY